MSRGNKFSQLQDGLSIKPVANGRDIKEMWKEKHLAPAICSFVASSTD